MYQQMNRNVRKRYFGRAHSEDSDQSDQNLHWAHFGYQEGKVSSCGQRRLTSDCADAQADLSLSWAHMTEGTFLHVEA